MWSEPRRAHPAAVVFYALRHIGSIFTFAFGVLVVGVLSLAAAERIFGALFVILVAVFAAIGSVVLGVAQWRRFTFMIDDGTLWVEQGLVIRKSIRLTPERIQSIDTKANIVFRILGLVTLEIRTAGRGQESEVSIPALTEEEARHLAEALRSPAPRAVVPIPAVADAADPAQSGEATAAAVLVPPQAGPSWSLTATELAIVSATSNGGPLVMAALGPVIVTTASTVMPAVPLVGFDSARGLAAVGLAAMGLIMFTVFAWVVGSAATALRYWDFITARVGEEVRVEQGLFQRNTRNVPLDRVQAVRLTEGPLRQMIGRVAVGVDSAGIGSGSEFGPTVLHPMLTRSEARRFCDLMVPGHDMPELAGPPARARRRYVVRAVTFPLMICLSLTALFSYGWLSLFVPAALTGWALLAFADAAWGRSEDVLAIRWRGIGRTTALVRRARIQSVAISQHPLQRIAGLASISVRVAASPATAVFTVRHVELTDAEALLDWVSLGAGRA